METTGNIALGRPHQTDIFSRICVTFRSWAVCRSWILVTSGRSSRNQKTDPRRRRGSHKTQKHVRNVGNDAPVTCYDHWRRIDQIFWKLNFFRSCTLKLNPCPQPQNPTLMCGIPRAAFCGEYGVLFDAVADCEVCKVQFSNQIFTLACHIFGIVLSRNNSSAL